MTPKRIQLDFVARPGKLPLLGTVALLAGVAAAYWTFTDFQNAMLESELLEMNLSRYQESREESRSSLDPEVSAQIKAAAVTLSTPWSALLNDFEQATGDSGKDIALLQVAPDRAKRQVRIAAEARSLPAALDYVQRLQNAPTLRYPTLDNHETRTADRQRPVRFEVTAEWRLSP